MIISIVSHKGGVGKTTTAIHLATYLQRNHGSTLLIDGDPNRSVKVWQAKAEAKGRGLGCAVATETEAPMIIMDERPQHIVIDTKANPNPEDLETLASKSNLILIPTTPESLAIDGALITIEMLQEFAGGVAPYRILVTMAPPYPQTSAIEARDAFSSKGFPVLDTIVPRAVGYTKAADHGVSVDEAPDRRAGELWEIYASLAEEAIDVIEK